MCATALFVNDSWATGCQAKVRAGNVSLGIRVANRLSILSKVWTFYLPSVRKLLCLFLHNKKTAEYLREPGSNYGTLHPSILFLNLCSLYLSHINLYHAIQTQYHTPTLMTGCLKKLTTITYRNTNPSWWCSLHCGYWWIYELITQQSGCSLKRLDENSVGDGECTKRPQWFPLWSFWRYAMICQLNQKTSLLHS